MLKLLRGAVLSAICASPVAAQTDAEKLRASEQREAQLRLEVAQLKARAEVTPAEQAARNLAQLTALFRGADASIGAEACAAGGGREFVVLLMSDTPVVGCIKAVPKAQKARRP